MCECCCAGPMYLRRSFEASGFPHGRPWSTISGMMSLHWWSTLKRHRLLSFSAQQVFRSSPITRELLRTFAVSWGLIWSTTTTIPPQTPPGILQSGFSRMTGPMCDARIATSTSGAALESSSNSSVAPSCLSTRKVRVNCSIYMHFKKSTKDLSCLCALPKGLCCACTVCELCHQYACAESASSTLCPPQTWRVLQVFCDNFCHICMEWFVYDGGALNSNTTLCVLCILYAGILLFKLHMVTWIEISNKQSERMDRLGGYNKLIQRFTFAVWVEGLVTASVNLKAEVSMSFVRFYSNCHGNHDCERG